MTRQSGTIGVLLWSACLAAASAADVKWVVYKDESKFPVNTVVAGPGRPVCRHDAKEYGVIPGTVVKDTVFQCQAGSSKDFASHFPEFEYLVATGVRWEDPSPQNKEQVIPGGYDRSNQTIGICRARPFSEGWTAGALIEGKCYLADGARFLQIAEYQVLVNGKAADSPGSADTQDSSPVTPRDAPREAKARSVTVVVADNFRKEARLALVVGVSSYPEGTGLRPLRFAASDADYLAQTLEANGYKVRKLTNEQASKGIIRRSLRELSELVTAGEGAFLFFYGGHGFSQDGKNYLATYGVTADDLNTDGLGLAEVEQLLVQSRARRAMMFIDACRANPFQGRTVGNRSFEKLAVSEGLKVLFATKEGQVSYEDDKLKHGIFSYFLGKGMQGQAAGDDGMVTFRDLTEYVTAQTRDYSVLAGTPQTPFEAGESSGDFLIAGMPASPAVTDTSVERPNSGPRKEDLWRNLQSGSLFEVALVNGEYHIFRVAATGERGDLATIATKKLRKDGTQDPKVLYEGVATRVVSDCSRSASGAFQITAISESRIEAKVEQMHGGKGSSNNGCGGPIGFFRIFTPFTLVKE